MKLWICAAIIGFPLAAAAGIPVSKTLTCPIGGAQFEITETASCTTYPNRTMSFAPTSSCDFITHLPQCPQSFLPMYKEFSDAELVRLERFMQSETYDSMVDRSRYYMAFIIDKQLGIDDPSISFSLLLQGLWYDPQNSFPDEGFTGEFLSAANAELATASPEDLPYLRSIMAFVLVKSGRVDDAISQLDLAVAEMGENSFLEAYHQGIQACIAESTSEYCDPTTLIPQD